MLLQRTTMCLIAQHSNQTRILQAESRNKDVYSMINSGKITCITMSTTSSIRLQRLYEHSKPKQC